MIDRIRLSVAPAYLALCLILGGSVQGVWVNAFLQLLAIVIIAWALLDRRAALLPPGARQLGAIAALGLIVVLVQLIPLPPALWNALPGRAGIADGFAMLGVSPGWLPLSLSPYDGLATLPTLLPPLAMLAAVLRFGARSSWMALSLLGVTLAAVVLGALQVAGPGSVQSPWYFYPISNFGDATGFFANANHMATLLLTAIPFAVALFAAAGERIEDVRKRTAALVVAGGILSLILVGLALNGSLFGLGLALPVLLASLVLILRPRRPWLRSAALGAGLLGLLAFVAIVATPLNERLLPAGSPSSVATRQTIAATSVDAFGTFGIAGTGLGSFAKAYRLFEDPAVVDRTFINHAHNDYLELAVELGIAGIALTLLFLAWWGRAAAQVLRSRAFDHHATAGLIASAVVLIHSAVDFPLRTAAVSALFAASLALMLVSKREVGSKTDLRPARHLVFD